MNKTINRIIDTILEVFDEREIEKIAYKVGVCHRRGKVSPLTFLAVCIFHSEDLLNNSLNSICNTLKIEYNIDISETGLNYRFTESAVKFLQYILDRLIKIKLPKNRFKDCYFKKIRIADSTIIKLPVAFHDDYPGSGPKSGKDLEKQFSAIKIQHEFDMLTGDILDIKIEEGTRNDALYLDYITPNVQLGDLCLRDLGYHKISDLQRINTLGGFFISKIKLTSAIYTKDFKINSVTGELVQCRLEKERRVYLEQLFEHLKPGDTLSIDNVLFGNKEKFPCRLIIYKLNDDCKGVKEKNIIYNLKKKRLKNSIYAEKFLDIVTYVTNIPEDLAKAEHIYDFYSLRWQIEILFKCWKSIFNIDSNKNMKIERFRCGLLGTLISIALSNFIYNEIKTDAYVKDGQVLSELKGFRHIKTYFFKLKTSILDGRRSLRKVIKCIDKTLRQRCTKSKKNHQILAENKVLFATK